MPDAFPILLDVEMPFVGPVLKLLNKTPGVAKIHLDFDKLGKPGSVRKAPAQEADRQSPGHSRTKKDLNGPTAKSIIINELVTGPKNVAHLRMVLKSHGLSPSNVSSTLYDLEGKNITTRPAIGLHQLTDEFMAEWLANHPSEPPPALAPPEPAPHAKRGASRPFVLQCVTEGKTRAEMNEAGKPLGINERMIDGALTRLKAEKAIVGQKDAPGVYVLAPAKVKPKQ